MEEKIKNLMTVLGVSEQQAEEIIKYDTEIDKMPMSKVNDDLNEEQQKTVKKMRGGFQSVDAYGKKRTRSKKENVIKANLISAIAEFLTSNENLNVRDLEVTNSERQISFSVNNDRFDLTLIQKRKKKG